MGVGGGGLGDPRTEGEGLAFSWGSEASEGWRRWSYLSLWLQGGEGTGMG